MAVRANVDLQDGLDTLRLKSIATGGATNSGFDVIWMDAFFHQCAWR